MSARASILIQEHPPDTGDWRKFAAILCFIEFYAQFVREGTNTWSLFDDCCWKPRENPYLVQWLIEFGLALLRATALYALGRSLWYHRRTSVYLLFQIILFSACQLVPIWLERNRLIPQPGCDCDMWGLGINIRNRGVMFAFAASPHLPWLLLLTVGLCAAHPRGSKWIRSRTSWAVMAAAWAFGTAAVCASPQHGIWILGHRPYSVPGAPWIAFPYVALPIAAGTLLLLRNPLAFLPATLLAVCSSGLMLYSSFAWSRFLALHPNGWRFLLNRQLFDLLCVQSVAEVGPWLLIAVFAWRARALTSRNDGSPYPRRFCARCHYNIHGLTTNHCPECGTELVPNPPEIEVTPNRQADPDPCPPNPV